MTERTVEIVADADRLGAITSHWAGLLAVAADATPYLSAPWVTAWWRHFGAGDRLHTVAVWDGERLDALAPLLVTCRTARRALVRVVVGVGQETADYGGFLLRPGAEAPAADLVLDEIGRLATGPHTVYLPTRPPPGGPALAALHAWAARHPAVELSAGEREPYPFRAIRPGPEGAAGLAKELKDNDVRRRLRRLREQGEVAFAYHEPGRAGPLLAEFLALHDRRWEQRGTAPTGLFSSPAGRRFLADAVEGLDAAGLLRISVLRVDGRAMAARFGFEQAGTYYGVKSGFDPAYARFGPGHLLVGLLLEELTALGARRFDFMRGAGDHKGTWAEGETEVASWVMARRGPVGRAARLGGRVALRSRYLSRQRGTRSSATG